MPIKRIAKIGKAEHVIVPDTLPYAAALSVLIHDLKETGITFDPDIFYSEDTVELDHPVASLVYRFIADADRGILVYEILDRPYEIYREVSYDGTVLHTFSGDAEFGAFASQAEQMANQARRQFMLG
jgi:hypothetical protein